MIGCAWGGVFFQVVAKVKFVKAIVWNWFSFLWGLRFKGFLNWNIWVNALEIGVMDRIVRNNRRERTEEVIFLRVSVEVGKCGVQKKTKDHRISRFCTFHSNSPKTALISFPNSTFLATPQVSICPKHGKNRKTRSRRPQRPIFLFRISLRFLHLRQLIPIRKPPTKFTNQ